MKYLSLSFLQEKLDVVCALIGVLIGLTLFLLNILYSNAYLISMAPLLLGASLIYLVVRRKWLEPAPAREPNTRVFLIAGIVFWLSLAMSIFFYSTASLVRPPSYFIFTTVAVAALVVQIRFASKRGVPLVLLQVILVSISVRATTLWVFPTIPGSDTWFHTAYAEVFAQNGAIPYGRDMPKPLSNIYLYFPLMHIDVVAMQLVTGLGQKAALFFAVSLPMIISTLFVYLIMRKLANDQVALVALLLLNLSDFHILWSVQPIPTTIGVMLFSAIAYLVIRDDGSKLEYMLFTLLFMIALVMTHTLSAFVLIPFLLFLLLGKHIYAWIHKLPLAGVSGGISLPLFLLFVAIVLCYWEYVATLSPTWSFLEVMINGGLIQIANAEYGSYSKPIIGPNYILNFMGFLILLLFTVWGVLIWLSKRHGSVMRAGMIAGLISSILVPFGSSAMGILLIIPDRWLAFLYVSLSAVAAVGIVTFVSHVRVRWLSNAMLVLIVTATSFFMITNRTTNSDSPLYTPEISNRPAYSNSELAAAEKVAEVFDGTIITDIMFGWGVFKIKLLRFYDVYYDMPLWLEDREQAWSAIEARHFDVESRPAREAGPQWRQALVIWRDVMGRSGVAAPRYVNLLGEDYENELRETHHAIYTSGSSTAYLAVAGHY